MLLLLETKSEEFDESDEFRLESLLEDELFSAFLIFFAFALAFGNVRLLPLPRLLPP